MLRSCIYIMFDTVDTAFSYEREFSHYVVPSCGRPEQGHLAHCTLGKSQQPKPEVRITRYVIAVFTYVFCESSQFSLINSTLHPFIQHCIHSFISKQSMQIHNIRYHVLLHMPKCHRSIRKWQSSIHCTSFSYL